MVSFAISGEGLRMEATGDIGSRFVLLKPKDGSKQEESLTVAVKKDISMTFGMRYLNLFTRATALCKQCSLNMTEGEPMMLQYNLGEDSHGFIRFLLAPKLDD